MILSRKGRSSGIITGIPFGGIDFSMHSRFSTVVFLVECNDCSPLQKLRQNVARTSRPCAGDGKDGRGTLVAGIHSAENVEMMKPGGLYKAGVMLIFAATYITGRFTLSKSPQQIQNK